MSGNAVKAYIYLLSASWLQEPRASIPSKPLALATLARCSKEEWDAISHEVLPAFKHGEETGDPAFNGRLFSERLLEESSKQLAKQRAGSLGGIAKASKTIAPATPLLRSKLHSETVAAIEDANANANEEEEEAAKEKTQVKKFAVPTKAELDFEGVRIGLPELELLKFVGHYEANGWKVGKNPMKSWRAALQNWKINYDEQTYSSGRRGNSSNPRRTISEERNSRIIGADETSRRIAAEWEQDQNAKPPFYEDEQGVPGQALQNGLPPSEGK